MKATTLIIAAVLTLSANALFAENHNMVSTGASPETAAMMVSLAPAVPAEATFEDLAVTADFAALTPVTPAEADFSDAAAVELPGLAPNNTAEATFDDADLSTGETVLLAPSVPQTADFE